MYGAIQVLRNAIFLEIGPPPPPRNANNIEHYTFVTLKLLINDFFPWKQNITYLYN